MSVPIRGRKTQTVGIAPTDVIQSMARIDDSGGSRPAMISPLVTHGSVRGPLPVEVQLQVRGALAAGIDHRTAHLSGSDDPFVSGDPDPISEGRGALS